MKLESAGDRDDVLYEGGDRRAYVNMAADRVSYACQECSATALEGPLFVTATGEPATEDGQLDTEYSWAFKIDDTDIYCATCSDASGVEVGLPAQSDETTLEELTEQTGRDFSPMDGDNVNTYQPDSGSHSEFRAQSSDPPPRDAAPGPKPSRERLSTDTDNESTTSSMHSRTDFREGIHPNALVNGDTRGEAPRRSDGGTLEFTGPPLFYRSVWDELVRLSGVKHTPLRETFPGRIVTAVKRQTTLRNLLVAMASVLAISIILERLELTASELALSAGAIAAAVAAGVDWPLLGLGVGAVAYGGHLIVRDRNWPPVNAEEVYDLKWEGQRTVVIGFGAAAAGAIVVFIAASLGWGPYVLSAIIFTSGTIAAMQFRRLHITVYHAGEPIAPPAVLSAGARGLVVVGGLVPFVATSLWTLIPLAAAPGFIVGLISLRPATAP